LGIGAAVAQPEFPLLHRHLARPECSAALPLEPPPFVHLPLDADALGGFLRARRERPSDCRSANRGYEFPPVYVDRHAVRRSIARSEVNPVGLRDAAEIERGFGAIASESNGGLIVTPSSLALTHRG
jgi:hypothetical protein